MTGDIEEPDGRENIGEIFPVGVRARLDYSPLISSEAFHPLTAKHAESATLR